MVNEEWKIGLGTCECVDEICETVSGDRSSYSHKDGNCHHPNGTHHRIHTSQEEHCPKCKNKLKPTSMTCHVHPKVCCSNCDWGR